jgi:hypothetical protein
MINISVEFDWDAAREHVKKYRLPDVQAHQESLQRYMAERGVDEVRQYLPTDYFDACGYRHWQLKEDAAYDREGAIEAMKRIMVAHIAQANIFTETESNYAFKQWTEGHHDT